MREIRRRRSGRVSGFFTVLRSLTAGTLLAVAAMWATDTLQESQAASEEEAALSRDLSPEKNGPESGSPVMEDYGALRDPVGPALPVTHRPEIPLRRSAEGALPSPNGLEGRASLQETGLVVSVDGVREVEFPLESLFGLPGDTVEIMAALDGGGGPLVLEVEGKDPVRGGGEVSWRWVVPPAPDLDLIRIRHPSSGTEVLLHAFSMTPAHQVEAGRLEGYPIGSYPTRALGGNPIYRPPPGFVRLSENNAHLRVSPHFTLGQFTAKQSQGFPKYVVLRPLLLRKLERVLEALQDRGYPVRSFHIMSGYRTPFYNNEVLGNARYSRHQWGGAVDIFVDERPRNGMMDDLNDDGRITVADAQVLHSIVDSLELDMGANFPVGGLGIYGANAVRGPFVHVDVRGTRARW